MPYATKGFSRNMGLENGTVLACLIFATAIPVHSALFLPPADFLPYNRGTNLDGHPDFAVFNRQYEEVTDSLLNLSGSKPLAIITTRKELMAEDWKKLKTFSTLAKQGDIALCLMSLPEQNKRNTMETYYADEVTLKSILRSEKGVLIVENSIIRAKWNLDTYPAKLIRHATRLKQLAAWNSWVAYRYGFCLLAGFLLIAWIRKKKNSPARMKTGDYIYKGIFALSLLCVAAVLAVGIHYGWRAFVADTFIVPSDSMQPTLMPGDKVKVDKLIFGLGYTNPLTSRTVG